MPKIQWIEICGFRAFAVKQRLDFSSWLALISGPNSHGKTSIAEAVEFLLCGETLRRSMLGGAKAEFEATLRNAHIEATSPVWIKAGILGMDGVVHEVKRTLTRDYPADGHCESELTIDGQPATDLSGLGILLSDPPLRTPILFQHNVRYALSSSPKARAEYFRAILEVADLEVVRNHLHALRDAVEPPPDPLHTCLERAAEVPSLRSVCEAIGAATDAAALEQALAQGMTLAAEELTIEGVDADRPLAEQAQVLQGATEAHGERAFPSARFETGELPTFELPSLEQTAAYTDAALAVDHEVERLRRLFEVTLALPHLADVTGPIDCPVCETANALTPARLEAMRVELAEAGEFRGVQTATRNELDELLLVLGRLEGALGKARPEAAGFAAEDFSSREEQAGSLVPDGATRLAAIKAPLQELATAIGLAIDELGKAREQVKALRESVADAKGIDPSAARSALEMLGDRVDSLETPHSAYQALAEPLLGQIRAAAAERQQVGGWAEFAKLARDLDKLLDAIEELRAHERVSKLLERAIKDVEQGMRKVLDNKFKAISSEITDWWRLLRPAEPVEFKEVGRRGEGRNYVLFKALLRPAPGADGVERDALGVFSDSQLNALGLSAFLARSAKQRSPFMILDDPVQAGDEEHRATFATSVLETLIDRDTQVIVISHEESLSKFMHNRYEHLPINGFAVTLETPGEGARVVATSDTAKAMLERAGATIKNSSPVFRKPNARKLRDAAERLAKEILVHERTEAGESATIADYKEQTLGPLIGKLEPYLTKPEDKGKWKNINEILSPGSHDDEIPTATALGIAYGDLKRFCRDYLGGVDEN